MLWLFANMFLSIGLVSGIWKVIKINQDLRLKEIEICIIELEKKGVINDPTLNHIKKTLPSLKL